MSVTYYVVLICATTPALVLVLLIVERIRSGRGIGVRSIQFAAAGTLPPIVAVLALLKAIDTATAATLLGAVVGALFYQFGDRD